MSPADNIQLHAEKIRAPQYFHLEKYSQREEDQLHTHSQREDQLHLHLH